MENKLQMAREVFLDTSYAIALSSEKDEFHSKAQEVAQEFATSGGKIITTRAVILEIGNALSKQRYRQAAVTLIDALEADPNVGIVPLTEPLFERALKLFRERQDKEWGLVDCISFVVMRERGIYSSLTTDDHFAQAGFRVLLRE